MFNNVRLMLAIVRIKCRNWFPVWEFLIPRQGAKHSQAGNNRSLSLFGLTVPRHTSKDLNSYTSEQEQSGSLRTDPAFSELASDMSPIWVWYEFDMTSIWVRYEFDMNSIWIRYDINMTLTWDRLELSLTLIWNHWDILGCETKLKQFYFVQKTIKIFVFYTKYYYICTMNWLITFRWLRLRT